MDTSSTTTTGTRVTCEDLTSGETESTVIRDNYVVITDGNTFVGSVQHYPGTGTTVLTIKRERVSA